MKEIDRLRMDRRKIEVEINQIKSKLFDKEEKIKEIDRRIAVIIQSGNSGEGFKATLFG